MKTWELPPWKLSDWVRPFRSWCKLVTMINLSKWRVSFSKRCKNREKWLRVKGLFDNNLLFKNPLKEKQYQEANLIFEFTFPNYGKGFWPGTPGLCTENTQMFGQGASMAFLVCTKILAPEKTSKCSRVLEPTLLNYCPWETISCLQGRPHIWHRGKGTQGSSERETPN